MQDADPSEVARLVQSSSHGRTPVVSGVRFPQRSKWPFSRLDSVRFEHVDFNSPILGGILSRPSIVDCDFVEVSFGGMNCARATFKNTSFRSCVFGRTTFGSVAKTRFESCQFDACEFLSMEFVDCLWIQCRFAASIQEKLNYRQCTFSEVVIEGRVTSVNFIGCSMDGLDLSGCKLTDTTVLDSPSQDVQLPDRPDNFVVTHKVLELAKGALRSKLSADGFEEYCAVADFAKQAPFGEIVDEEMFEDLSPTERSLVLRVLFENRKHT